MFSNKRLMGIVVVVVVLALSLLVGSVGCAKPATEPVTEEIQMLVAGPPAVWSSYPVIVGMSDIISRNSNLHLTVRSVGGATPQITAVIAREADIAGGPSDRTQAMTYFGFGDWEGKPPTSTLRSCIAYMNLLQSFVVTKGGGITSVADLKGKTVARFTTMGNIWFEAIIEAYGLSLERDIVWVTVPDVAAAMDEMRMGRLDAIFGSLDGADIMELGQAVGGVRVLPIEPDKFSWMKENRSRALSGTLLTYIQPEDWQPYLIDITEPLPVFTNPLFMSAREEISEDVIYTLTKTLLNHIPDVQALGPITKDFGPEIIKSPSAIPYHNGAIKALKEANMWTQEMEQVHQAVLRQ